MPTQRINMVMIIIVDAKTGFTLLNNFAFGEIPASRDLTGLIKKLINPKLKKNTKYVFIISKTSKF